MTQSLNPALTAIPRMPGFLAAAKRYALSTAGPVATSGAHFLASLLFVLWLSYSLRLGGAFTPTWAQLLVMAMAPVRARAGRLRVPGPREVARGRRRLQHHRRLRRS